MREKFNERSSSVSVKMYDKPIRIRGRDRESFMYEGET